MYVVEHLAADKVKALMISYNSYVFNIKEYWRAKKVDHNSDVLTASIGSLIR